MITDSAPAPLDTGAHAPTVGELRATDGGVYGLSSFAAARLLAVVFVSNGCPTVRAYEDRLSGMHHRYADQGVTLVAVNANNPHLSPGDAYERMVARAHDHALPYPYLKDDGGRAARAFGAICTPHAFLFDEGRSLRYRGRIDDARDPTQVTCPDLENAIGALLDGRAPARPVTEPFGCAIVW